MTWITGYWEAHEVLRSSDFVADLHNRHSYPVVGESILTLEGDAHLSRRRTELPLFSRAALERYEFECLVPSIRQAFPADHPADVQADLLRVMQTALLRVSAAVIGLDEVTSEERTQQMRGIAQRVGEAASVEWSTRDVTDIVREALEAKREFVATFYAPSLACREGLVAAWRAGQLSEEELPVDLITILLKAHAEWDDDQLLRECLFYLAASVSTTTNAAPHAFMELWTWVEGHPEDRALLSDLSFLQRAVAEALRIHPTVPALIRRSLGDVTLTSSGRSIAAGEQLAVDLKSVNCDPALFGENGSRFDPHRQLPRRVQPYATAFAAGPHTCLGRRMAVGSGNGTFDSGDEPVGVLTRLMQELFRRDVSADPDNPPVLRTDTSAERYERFPVIVHATR
jgi:cytochrome P450